MFIPWTARKEEGAEGALKGSLEPFGSINTREKRISSRCFERAKEEGQHENLIIAGRVPFFRGRGGTLGSAVLDAMPGKGKKWAPVFGGGGDGRGKGSSLREGPLYYSRKRGGREGEQKTKFRPFSVQRKEGGENEVGSHVESSMVFHFILILVVGPERGGKREGGKRRGPYRSVNRLRAGGRNHRPPRRQGRPSPRSERRERRGAAHGQLYFPNTGPQGKEKRERFWLTYHREEKRKKKREAISLSSRR